MSIFSEVRGNEVGRSVFNLSHTKRFTCDMGQLIPALFLECVPGDTFKIGCEVVTRLKYVLILFDLLFDNDKFNIKIDYFQAFYL